MQNEDDQKCPLGRTNPERVRSGMRLALPFRPWLRRCQVKAMGKSSVINLPRVGVLRSSALINSRECNRLESPDTCKGDAPSKITIKGTCAGSGIDAEPFNAQHKSINPSICKRSTDGNMQSGPFSNGGKLIGRGEGQRH